MAPFSHAAHEALAPELHATTVEVPAGQGTHVEGAVEPARQNRPAGHGSCTVAFGQKKPVAHVEAAADPVGQNWPATQGVTVGAAESGQKLPAGQGRQLTLAVVLHGAATYWPREHAPHAVQALVPATVEYVSPGSQSTQVAFCDGVQALAV